MTEVEKMITMGEVKSTKPLEDLLEMQKRGEVNLSPEQLEFVEEQIKLYDDSEKNLPLELEPDFLRDLLPTSPIFLGVVAEAHQEERAAEKTKTGTFQDGYVSAITESNARIAKIVAEFGDKVSDYETRILELNSALTHARKEAESRVRAEHFSKTGLAPYCT